MTVAHLTNLFCQFIGEVVERENRDRADAYRKALQSGEPATAPVTCGLDPAKLEPLVMGFVGGLAEGIRDDYTPTATLNVAVAFELRGGPVTPRVTAPQPQPAPAMPAKPGKPKKDK